MTTVAELITILQGKDPSMEVEYFVVTPAEKVVAMNISGKIATSLVPLFKRLAEKCK